MVTKTLKKTTTASTDDAAASAGASQDYRPMLAHDYRQRAKAIRFPCWVQPKLDGVRAVWQGAQTGTLRSRGGISFPPLDHITDELRTLPADLAYDGELYSDTLSFQELSGLVRKVKRTAQDLERLRQVHLWVYDYVDPGVPYTERWRRLQDALGAGDVPRTYVHLLPTVACARAEDMPALHDQFVAQGYEGIILRNAAGLYTPGKRSADLQKYKVFIDDEFVITGYGEGEGAEAGLVLWECITPQGHKFMVRPRGTHAERADLYRRAAECVGQRLTVRFQELTTDGLPRFPIGIAIRPPDDL